MKTNHQSGHDNEKAAAKYLQSLGYKIISLNWKTPQCEIDIVASKNSAIWFIEVKSRRSSAQGYGYEYVTSRKLTQMHFAASMWVAAEQYSGDYRLAVISVDGGEVTFIDSI